MGLAKIRRSKPISYWRNFDTWLSHRGQSVRFIPRQKKQCPLAYYTNSNIYAAEQRLRHELHKRPLPAWAVEFIDEFDNRTPRTKKGEVTAYQTRLALNRAVVRMVEAGRDLTYPRD
jgi:hypothetical protein